MFVVANISALVYVVGVLLGCAPYGHDEVFARCIPSAMDVFVREVPARRVLVGLGVLVEELHGELVLVVFPVVMYQRCSVMIISVLYLTVVALVWPYRSNFCNRAGSFARCPLSSTPRSRARSCWRTT